MTPNPFDALLSRHAAWLFVLAHPGHELRAYHVLERARPRVAVLTDGSGGSATSRIDDTRVLLKSVGAVAAEVFGAVTDRQAYEGLMSGEAAGFLAVADALVLEIHRSGVTAVVVDAAEGYNPVHDVCHWIGRAVVDRAAASTPGLEAFELDLVGHPDGRGPGVRIALDGPAFDRKLRAIAEYSAVAGEAAAAFARYGRDAFRTEFLRALGPAAIPPAAWVPEYERIGDERVRSGQYSSVLRYHQHVRPVLEALVSTGAIAHANAAGTAHK